MSTDLDTIKEIARASLMPDFFAARVDEEGLWARLRQLLSGIGGAAPATAITTIKRLAGEAKTAVEFIDKIKVAKLWPQLRELIGRIQVS